VLWKNARWKDVGRKDTLRKERVWKDEESCCGRMQDGKMWDRKIR
jgi:hypothetical protein